MLPELHPATDDLEEKVLGLHLTAGALMRVGALARAFGAGTPEELAGKPWVTMTREGAVTGFAVTHPRRFRAEGEYHEAQVMTDFLTTAADDGDGAARVLLEELPRRASMTLAGGWSAAGVRALRHYQWRYFAPWPRLRIAQGAGPRKLKAELARLTEFPEGLATRAERAMVEEGTIFIERLDGFDSGRVATALADERERVLAVTKDGAIAGYLRVRRVRVAAGEELHLVDARLPLGAAEEAAAALLLIARAEKAPLYATFLHAPLEKALLALGAEAQKPRWGLFASGNPTAMRHATPPLRLTSQSPWSLFPGDVELDVSE